MNSQGRGTGVEVCRVPPGEIMPLRELYRREMGSQIIHDSFAARGFSDAYLLRVDGRLAGYGLVARRHYPETVHEFHALPAVRGQALPMFRALLETSGATGIRAQTNDRLLLLMLHDCAAEIVPEAVLFEDGARTDLTCPEGTFLAATEHDGPGLREGGLDPEAGWLIESGGIPVAAGGVLSHYNPPYGDLYMAVREDRRRRGFGSFLVQELKRVAYESGKVPAARCNIANTASRRTLEKAGMLPCGHVLAGKVASKG
jgi:GNAT superfamily N-acetyltransferase